ncbi:Melibiose/raffinose/stachyose import permease protein MelD [Paraburkholderia ultramafica]|uniref:Melibiose/raffinose/stachyose import permease protein MelD n=1 Tax=Paraburkholderia ultramafica TaxID=1544867 RepID=A0A6S7CBU0_9BURK|nr:sugar ABC transporter permease [Paraburkholderia ultramafica]CAB3776492.1 Melibiose/raffinose/stachyose import permease protein MelD [Paraburkholderia ultramafica]
MHALKLPATSSRPGQKSSNRPGNKPLRKRVSIAVWLALLPMVLTVVFAYLGTMVWTARVSLSNSRTFPSGDFAGFTQYVKLFHNDRWLLSLQNIVICGACFIVACMVIGLLLAIFVDQRVVAEGALRTVFLYPYAMSFVATGLVWQWILNPELGAQAVLHKLGFVPARFDWIVDQDWVIYTIVIATVWQASGLVMALLLAGLRGIDDELWKAARIDGIPRWRVYASIVVPMLGPSISTAFVLLFVMVVKLYDAVVAMTQGGPGTASEVPAKFIMDYLFGRANIGLASAASIVLLATVLAILAPFFYARSHAALRKEVW